jgi:hypothetical protein
MRFRNGAVGRLSRSGLLRGFALWPMRHTIQQNGRRSNKGTLSPQKRTPSE